MKHRDAPKSAIGAMFEAWRRFWTSPYLFLLYLVLFVAVILVRLSDSCEDLGARIAAFRVHSSSGRSCGVVR